MSYIGKGNQGQLPQQEAGIQPTIQQLMSLLLQNLTVQSGAVLPGFDSLVVNPTGTAQLGTVTSGVWEGTEVAQEYGGTGLSSYSPGDILYVNGAGNIVVLPSGAEGTTLTISAGALAWV